MDTEDANEDTVPRRSFERHSEAALAYAYIQWLLDQDKKHEEERKRATTITKIECSIDERSLMSHVIKALSSEKDGLHINAIIDKVEQLGYRFKSKYHTYSRVYSIFSNNPSIFMKRGRATFRLRNGLLGTFKEERKPAAQRVAADHQSIIPTKRDIIVDIMTEQGLNDPREVYYTMMSMGISVSYQTVKKTVKESSHE